MIYYMTRNIWDKYESIRSGLQITVGHWKLAHQNLLMSNKIPTKMGHDVQTKLFFYHKAFYSKGEYKPIVSKSYFFWWCPATVCFVCPRWCPFKRKNYLLPCRLFLEDAFPPIFLEEAGNFLYMYNVSYFLDGFWWKRVNRLAKAAPWSQSCWSRLLCNVGFLLINALICSICGVSPFLGKVLVQRFNPIALLGVAGAALVIITDSLINYK